MVEKNSRIFPQKFAILCLQILLVFACSQFLSAQEKQIETENERSKEQEYSGNLTKVEGRLHCNKPEPAYAIEVPDRSGHALMLGHRKCTWTEPLEVFGAKTKDGVFTDFTERMEGSLHMHGFEVDTLDSGEKLTMRMMNQILAVKGPADMRGRWSFMRGTGKFKGIKGGGNYEGKLDADNGLTLHFEGVYEPQEKADNKK
jgi:hypothetical protein